MLSLSTMKRIAAVLALAGLLLVSGCGESDAHKRAAQRAELDAKAHCSIVEGLGGYSDEWARCVKDQAKDQLHAWEAAHPND